MLQRGSAAVIGVQHPGQPAEEEECDLTSPAFAARLGSLLEATRRRNGKSIRDLAATTGGESGPTWLRRLERGSLPLDEAVIEAVCHLYGADLGAILPARVSLAIEDRVMLVDGLRVTFPRDDPTAVLKGYLRLIRGLRDQKKAPAIALRRDDIDRLAAYLSLDGEEVLDRLASLMGATAAQRIAFGSLFTAGAVVIGLVAAGNVDADGATVPAEQVVVAVLDSASIESSNSVATVDVVDNASQQSAPTENVAAVENPRPPTSGAAEVPAPATTIPPAAEAVTPPTTMVETTGAADSRGLAPAVRVLAPVAVAPTVTVVENRSGCNTDPAGAVMTLTISDISYGCPVYAGGQAQIDAGFVTLVTAAGANAVLATEPGAPGTLWLAAHRASHGAAFADVPGLADGALITISDGGVTATYRVVSRTYVEVRNDQVIDARGNATSLATWESIIRTDLGGNLAPRLVLQTCEGVNFRWMIYADLVA